MAVADLFATTMFAQNPNRGENGRRGMSDGVVSMAVIKKMGLDSAMVSKIIALRDAKRTEMRTVMEEMQKKAAEAKEKKDKKDKKDKKNVRGQFPAENPAMQAWKKEYRNELRKIMGTETYIEYLEQMADMASMQMRMRAAQGQGRGFGGNGPRPQGFGGGQMPPM